MKRVNQIVEQSITALAELGNIESRTQFGGYALAVERVVFAYINDDTLYLRASEALRRYATQRPLEMLVYRKRGIPVRLSYFRVDQVLWQDRAQLVKLSASSLQTARKDAATKSGSPRLKDLPNLSLRMELMLYKAGISTVQLLQEMGSRQSWLKLQRVNRHIGLKTLLALEGAISGHHQAALPDDVRQALCQWYQERLRQPAAKRPYIT